jgi:putative endonuclease
VAPRCDTFSPSVQAVSHARQHLGRIGEQLAAEHLARLGLEIVERNFRTRWGELDIVAFDAPAGILAFAEVKTRRAPGAGAARPENRSGAFDAGPLDAIHGPKRARVRRMASQWLAERPDHPYARELRFDAIGITLSTAGALLALEHLEGAF